MAERLPCGCPDMDEWMDPCPGHIWTHWHPSPIDALREDRFCFYCGEMETQRICEPPHNCSCPDTEAPS